MKAWAWMNPSVMRNVVERVFRKRYLVEKTVFIDYDLYGLSP